MSRAGGLNHAPTRLRAVVAVTWQVLVILMLGLVALQPAGADGPSTGLALLPLAACQRFGQRAPLALACPVAALAGSCLDILAQGPIGFWGLIHAAAAALGAQAHNRTTDGFGGRWALLCLDLAVLAVLQAALVMACTLAVPDWGTILRQSVAAAAAYPLLAVMMPLPGHTHGPTSASRLAQP